MTSVGPVQETSRGPAAPQRALVPNYSLSVVTRSVNQRLFKCGSHGLSQRVNAATLLPRAMEYATPATWRLAPITRSRSLFDVYSGFYSTSMLLQPVKAAPSQGCQPPPNTLIMGMERMSIRQNYKIAQILLTPSLSETSS
jgi:hypothetical protein